MSTPTLAPVTAAAVEVHGAYKSYGAHRVLDGVDLTVQPGQVAVILGPSGSGKSTLLRTINHLEKLDVGHVSVNGELIGVRRQGDRLKELSERAILAQRSGIGFVFQGFNLFPHLTVVDNVATAPVATGRATREEARAFALELLDRVGLADKADAYPRQLSGGMRMRVSIARALVTAPRVLLMDEPFAALDEITRFKLNDDLVALWRELRMTVVFVTHSVFESVFLSGRIVVMTPRPGRVAAELAIDAAVRDANFRTSAEYAGTCRVVSEALAQATRAPGAAA
jgi:polar amino acid transport system ATP-binding protein